MEEPLFKPVSAGMKKTAIYTAGDLENAIAALFRTYPEATIADQTTRLRTNLANWIGELRSNKVPDGAIRPILESAKAEHPTYAGEFDRCLG